MIILEANKRFNNFVLTTGLPINKDKRYVYEVKCNCGFIGLRRLDHLERGRSKMCKSCASKKTAAIYGTPDTSQAVGDLGRVYYSSLKSGAARRDLEWEVSQEFLWSLLEAQDFRCALSGIPINLSVKIRNSNPDYTDFTASLDRIEQDEGYLKTNVQWVHKDINRMKWRFTEDNFIHLCSCVSKHKGHGGSCGV